MDQTYEDGSEVHVGDLVSYAGQRGTIVFVVDRHEYSDMYPETDWPPSNYPAGFMIEFANGARLLLDSPDEDLQLITGAIAR